MNRWQAACAEIGAATIALHYLKEQRTTKSRDEKIAFLEKHIEERYQMLWHSFGVGKWATKYFTAIKKGAKK